MKKEIVNIIILLVVCVIVCGYIFFIRTNDVKIIIVNQSHDLKDINDAISYLEANELIYKTFPPVKNYLLYSILQFYPSSFCYPHSQ